MTSTLLGQRVALSVFLAAVASGCDDGHSDPELPTGTIEVTSGRRVVFGGCFLSVLSVRVDESGQFVARAGSSIADSGSSQPAQITVPVKQGDVMPTFGQVYRVVAVRRDLLGLSVDDPAVSKSLFVSATSLVLPPGGWVELPVAGGHPAAVVVWMKGVARDSAGRLIANLDIYAGEDPPYAARPQDYRPLAVAVEDTVIVHGLRHRVLAIREADPTRGLPAWVEIDPRGAL